jgi:hypothetical protein
MTSPSQEFPRAWFLVLPSLPANEVSYKKIPFQSFISPKYLQRRVPTLRTKPGVSIIVRLGQCAYSALITIGLGETAVLVFFKSASVLDFMISAIADAKTTGLPYSSESSSCFQFSIFSKIFVNKNHPKRIALIFIAT